MSEQDDFKAYRKLIIKQLELHEQQIEALRSQHQDLKIKLAILTTKASVYAAIISLAISTAIAALLKLIK